MRPVGILTAGAFFRPHARAERSILAITDRGWRFGSPVINGRESTMILQTMSATDRLHAYVPLPSPFQQRLRVIEVCVELLIDQAKIGELWTEGYREAARRLATLPLATDDYKLTKQHIDNALRYCRCNEFAAAAFELRIVRGRLQRT
jgi:hypothetical protein